MEVKKFSNYAFTYSEALGLYSRHIHELNAHWWQNPDGSPKQLDKGERFMLMISELAEGLEGDRKVLMDNHLPQYPMLWVELADTVIRVLDSGAVYGWEFTYTKFPYRKEYPTTTVGGQLFNIVRLIDQLADADRDEPKAANYLAFLVVHRCVELAVQEGCPHFWNVVYDKLVYNQTRVDHTWEARLAGGKKY